MVLLDPPHRRQAAPLPNLDGLLKEWGITLGNNVVVDVSGATNDPSIAVAATYPQHPITERFATLTIYPLRASVDPVRAAPNGRTAQPIVETSRGAGPRRTSRRSAARPASRWTRARATSRARSRSPSRCPRRSRRAAAAASTPATGEALEARDPGGRVRRLRLRQQRVRRRPGQHRPVREHDQLAGAAGEPDRHPAEGGGRPPRHDDAAAADDGAF